MLAAGEALVAKLTGRIAERDTKSERVAALPEPAAMAEAARGRADRWAQLDKAAKGLAEAESALAELGYDENAAGEIKSRLEDARAQRMGLVEELGAVGTQLASDRRGARRRRLHHAPAKRAPQPVHDQRPLPAS
jgi:hypothetical protein